MTNNYPNIIEEGLLISKWSDDIQRRELAELYLDLFRGSFRDALCDILEGQLDTREYKELRKYLESEGITERIINETALIFSEEASIELENVSESVQNKFQELLETVNIQVVLENINKYTKLVRDLPVIPQYINKKLRLSIITPEKCFVEQHPDDPTDFIKFYYQVGIIEDSPGRIGRIDVYHFWDASEGKPKKYECQVNPIDGRVNIDSILQIEAPDFKEMPVVIFRDYLPDDSVWYKGSSDIIDKAIATDLRRTELAMAESYSIPMLKTRGMPADQYDRFKRGRVFQVNIPPAEAGGELGDAGFIQPEEKLQELSDRIAERYQRLALGKGLSMSQISGENATSGYHLALSMSKILDLNKRERKYYRPAIKKMVRLLCSLAKQAKFANFPENPEVKIDFGELTFAESPAENEKLWALKFSNKTANLIDYELDQNPDLQGDRKEALKIVQERLAENKIINPNPFEVEDAEGSGESDESVRKETEQADQTIG